MKMRYFEGSRMRQLGMTCVAAALWISSAQQAQAVLEDPYVDWEIISVSELANLRGGFFTGSDAFDFRVTYDASLEGFTFGTELSYAAKTFNVTVGELNGASLIRDADGNLSLVDVPADSVGLIEELPAGNFQVSIDGELVANFKDGGPEDLELTVLLPVLATLKVGADGVVLDIGGGDELRILSSVSSRRISNNVVSSLSTIAKLATTLDIQLGSELTSMLSTIPPFLQRLNSQRNSLY